jgi:hypothetical protein
MKLKLPLPRGSYTQATEQRRQDGAQSSTILSTDLFPPAEYSPKFSSLVPASNQQRRRSA